MRFPNPNPRSKMAIVFITNVNVRALSQPNSITISKAQSFQYYFFHSISWLWPGEYSLEFKPHSKRLPNIEPLRLTVSVKVRDIFSPLFINI